MKNWSIQTVDVENGLQAMKNRLHARGGQCAHCTSTKGITIDHIIPQQFFVILGFTEAYKEQHNLQLLCKPCNVKKANTLDYTNPKTRELLVEYVNRWLDKHDKMELKRMTRKITARCQCCPEQFPVIAPARATWRSKPGMAPFLKPDVVHPESEVNQDNW